MRRSRGPFLSPFGARLLTSVGLALLVWFLLLVGVRCGLFLANVW